MTYDQAKYQALRGAKVPHKMALALAQDGLPNVGADPVEAAGISVDPLAPEATNEEIIDKINELIGELT